MDAVSPQTLAPTRAALVVAVLRTALTGGPAFALRDQLTPLALTVGLVVLVLGWNMQAGLVLHPSPLVAIASCAALFVLAGVARWRLVPLVAELALYFGLWLCFPAFATLLSYLCIGAGWPLQDHALAAADAAPGFDWLTWYGFVARHPLFRLVQGVAYFSLIWQALAAILILALWRPGRRNAELLAGMLIGVLLTLLVATLAPAPGPGAYHDHPPGWLPTALAVRAHAPGPLGYAGIVSFPSFHTVMAILFVYAQRGLRWSFVPFLVVNLLLLTGTPAFGSHYLADMLAGAVVAGVAIVLARRLTAHDGPATRPNPAGRGQPERRGESPAD